MSDDEFISYDDSDSGVSYSPEPDHEDEDDYIGKELIFNRELVSTVLRVCLSFHRLLKCHYVFL